MMRCRMTDDHSNCNYFKAGCDFRDGQRERELIRQSNLDLELVELEERHIREIREEGLPRPVLIKPGESDSEAEKESPLDQPADEVPF
jgi:hypothetical protein